MRDQLRSAGTVASTQAGLPPFRLYRPHNLQDAITAIDADPEALVISGGTDFFAQVREGLVPEALVTVRRLPELASISCDDGVMRIGAGVTHEQGRTDPILRDVLPSLAEAWGRIATVRIRRTGTIGGNLLARRNRYEMPLLAGALDARLEFLGEHAQPVDWLWQGQPGAHERLLTGVAVDVEKLHFFGYERSMRPVTTLALAVRRCEGGLTVRAVAGSEYRPGYVLELESSEKELEELHVPDVAAGLAAQLPPEAADYTGGHDYRRHLVEVLSARLLRREQDRRLAERN